MAQETKPLPYKEFAEHIDEHLDALDEPGSELTMYRGKRAYRVVRKDDELSRGAASRYDAERLRRTIESHRYDGLPGVDIQDLKRYLKSTRSQDSEGRPG